MRKRDAEGNLLAISLFNLSSFARPQSPSGYGLWTVFNLDVDDGETFDFGVALGYERLGDSEKETDPEHECLLRSGRCARELLRLLPYR